MKILLALMLSIACAAAAFAAAAPSPSAAAKQWVCPPCGVPCDTLHFDAPGTCPKCGMALVEATSAAAQPDPTRKKIAILVFDGVEILDSTGPYEMFGAAGYDVYTVSATGGPVTTAMGMTVVPKWSFANAPAPDVLVVPGGGVRATAKDAATLQWVTATSARAPYTMSVCNGAFILAAAGLLDGLTATTTSGNIERLADQYPKIRVVRDKRFVDNGKIITTAGLSAGMDGALHVIERMQGRGTAQQVALSEEYDWHAEGEFARASFADTQIPNIPLDSLGTFEVVRTEGTTTHWEIEAEGTTHTAAPELMQAIARALENGGRWAPVPGTASAASMRQWTFTGRDGQPWNGQLRIDPATDAAGRCRIALTIARAG